VSRRVCVRRKGTSIKSLVGTRVFVVSRPHLRLEGCVRTTQHHRLGTHGLKTGPQGGLGAVYLGVARSPRDGWRSLTPTKGARRAVRITVLSVDGVSATTARHCLALFGHALATRNAQYYDHLPISPTHSSLPNISFLETHSRFITTHLIRWRTPAFVPKLLLVWYPPLAVCPQRASASSRVETQVVSYVCLFFDGRM
jgi:hypothetical protein